jgi:transketolase
MSLAPLAYTLFQRALRHDPADPHWVGRDRFVLSAGHSSLTLYVQLYLASTPVDHATGVVLRRQNNTCCRVARGICTPGLPQNGAVAVGTALTGGPPHRSQRAGLPHWAPTSGVGVKAHTGPGMRDADGW